MALSYPNINSVSPDFAKLTLTFTNTNTPIPVPIIGFSALSYGTSSNGELVHGAAEIAIGQTAGQQTPTAKCTMYVEEYSTLIAAISNAGGGYMTQLFNVGIAYTTQGGGVLTDMLFGCRIKDDSSDYRLGGTALQVSFDLQPTYIVRNGILPNDDLINVTSAFLSFITSL